MLDKKLTPKRRYTINGAEFIAYTKSEARADAKEKFGWERVPVGMTVLDHGEVEEPEPVAQEPIPRVGGIRLAPQPARRVPRDDDPPAKE